MSLEFLSPAADARSRAARWSARRSRPARRLEQRDGWNVAVGFDGRGAPPARRSRFADRSHLGKLELFGEHGLELGQATRRDDAWWCPTSRERALVLCEPDRTAELREQLGARGRGPHLAPWAR